MTEDEFKITLRAYFPNIGFHTIYCGNVRLTLSDELCSDSAPSVRFKYSRDESCEHYERYGVRFGELWLNVDEYPDLLSEIAKGMHDHGFYVWVERFLKGIGQ